MDQSCSDHESGRLEGKISVVEEHLAVFMKLIPLGIEIEAKCNCSTSFVGWWWQDTISNQQRRKKFTSRNQLSSAKPRRSSVRIVFVCFVMDFPHVVWLRFWNFLVPKRTHHNYSQSHIKLLFLHTTMVWNKLNGKCIRSCDADNCSPAIGTLKTCVNWTPFLGTKDSEEDHLGCHLGKGWENRICQPMMSPTIHMALS